jgi:hypothetical protein
MCVLLHHWLGSASELHQVQQEQERRRKLEETARALREAEQRQMATATFRKLGFGTAAERQQLMDMPANSSPSSSSRESRASRLAGILAALGNDNAESHDMYRPHNQNTLVQESVAAAEARRIREEQDSEYAQALLLDQQRVCVSLCIKWLWFETDLV